MYGVADEHYPVAIPAWNGRHDVDRAQDLQRLMFSEAIGRPLPVTVMRNGALVDVIAEPAELVAA